MAGPFRFLAVYVVTCALTVAGMAFLLAGVLGTDLVEVGRWLRARPVPRLPRHVQLPDQGPAVAARSGVAVPAERLAHAGVAVAER